MALLQGAIDTAWRRYNTRRALTGLPGSYQEQRGMLDPIMEAAANKDIQEAQLRYQNERANKQLSLQEQAQKDAARAANISGVANVGQLGLGGYLGYKYLTKPPSALETAMANHFQSLTPSAVPSASAIPSAGAFSAPTAEAAGFGLHTSPYAAPALSSGVAGVGSGGAGILSGAGSGAAAAGGTDVAGLAAYDASMAEGAAAGVGSSAGTGAAASAGLLSTVAPIAAGWGIGSLADTAIDKLSPIGGAKEKSIAGNIAKGAGLGAGIGSVVPGVGTLIGGAVGAVVGGVVGLAEDVSVICSELLRQGRITRQDRTKCVVFRFRHIPNDMFLAYLEWAEPHVEAMKRGGWRNAIRLPFAYAFVRYMISIHDRKLPTLSQRIVWKYAWWRCSMIARKHSTLGVSEVA